MRQHLSGTMSIPPSELFLVAAAAAYAFFAATCATDAAFRTIAPILNPPSDICKGE